MERPVSKSKILSLDLIVNIKETIVVAQTVKTLKKKSNIILICSKITLNLRIFHLRFTI